jgi:hypothetical protein
MIRWLRLVPVANSGSDQDQSTRPRQARTPGDHRPLTGVARQRIGARFHGDLGDALHAGPAVTAIANWTGRITTMIAVFLDTILAASSGVALWTKHAPVFIVAGYLAVAAAAAIWVLYRGWRMGVRFDDHGVTACKFLWTSRFSWPEVRRFQDGWVPAGGGSVRPWALTVVPYKGGMSPRRWGTPVATPATRR